MTSTRDRRIDDHTDRVACQTCHIPLMAVKTGTKLSWDWSQAGQDLPITNEHLYLKIKGRFTWVTGAQPEYAWYNGNGERYLLGDKIDPKAVTNIAAPLGDREDPEAKLHPFKIHRGKQVYDTVHRHFILPHTFGEKGFWTQFDWDEALRIGSEVTGLPYSGQFDFARTKMFMPQNHMVTVKEKALQCPDCHGPAGRIHWRRLGYDHDPITRPVLLHEPIPLLDADGEMVHESGNPLSAAMTCSQCHEIEEDDFLATHAYHSTVVAADLNPERRALMQQGPRIPLDDGQQMNCFLCHIERPNLAEWQGALRSGEPDWAVAATLIGSTITLKGTEILERTDQGYQWNAGGLDEDELAVIPMAQPRPEHCGSCHGLVHTDNKPLMVKLGSDENWGTETTGQVFSAQRIRLSALNLRDKDTLGRAWDLHAQRLVECRDCHYAKTPPERLTGGNAAASETHAGGGLRDCDSCHADMPGHDWLPEQQKHFAAVACESCHAPRLYLPARQQVDASVLMPDGESSGELSRTGRGITGRPGPRLLDRIPTPADGDPCARGRRQMDTSEPGQPLVLGRGRQRHRGRYGTVARRLVRRWALSPTGASHCSMPTATGPRPRGTRVGPGRKGRADPIAAGRRRAWSRPVLKAEIRAHHMHHSVALDDANRDCDRCHEASTEGDFDTRGPPAGQACCQTSSTGCPNRSRTGGSMTADGGLTCPGRRHCPT